MSKKRDFIPRDQATRKTNGKKFTDELVVDGTNFGITAQEVTDAGTEWGDLNTEMGKSVVTDAAAQSQTQTTNTADGTFETTWRKLAGKIKKSNNYNPSVGERYMIIGDEMNIDVANSAPELKIKKVPSGWEITFNLQGFFTGVKIYRKRQADAAFSYIATDLSSPYIDTDPQVSGTQYYAYYLRGDTAVGQQSAVVTVQV